MIKRLIELFTGKKIVLTDLSAVNDNTSSGTSGCCTESDVTAHAEAHPMEGWGVRYDLQKSYSESETTSVDVQGIVQTSDGREISFNLNLQIDRSYMEQNNLLIRLGDATRIDALVLNIDENDSAYSSLSIWQRDQEGNESLVSLDQANIGAINIGFIKSPFDLKDYNNKLQGQILRTGVYLSNAGMAGSVQQLDVAI
jgi:hypothetical protein